MKYIRSFDKVFVVTLERSKQRQYKISYEMERLGIPFEFFYGIDGYFEKQAYQQYVSNLPPKTRPMSPGALGLVKAYINLFQHAMDSGYQKILIFEDDVIFHRRFLQESQKRFQQIPDNWKIVQFGISFCRWNTTKKVAGKGYFHPGYSCGTFAWAVDRSIFQEIIDGFKQFTEPADHMLFPLYQKYQDNCFALYPYMVIANLDTISFTRGYYGQEKVQQMYKQYKWGLYKFDQCNARLINRKMVGNKCNIYLSMVTLPENGQIKVLFNEKEMVKEDFSQLPQLNRDGRYVLLCQVDFEDVVNGTIKVYLHNIPPNFPIYDITCSPLNIHLIDGVAR